jgi:hypothetical protein
MSSETMYSRFVYILYECEAEEWEKKKEERLKGGKREGMRAYSN